MRYDSGAPPDSLTSFTLTQGIYINSAHCQWAPRVGEALHLGWEDEDMVPGLKDLGGLFS